MSAASICSWRITFIVFLSIYCIHCIVLRNHVFAAITYFSACLLIVYISHVHNHRCSIFWVFFSHCNWQLCIGECFPFRKMLLLPLLLEIRNVNWERGGEEGEEEEIKNMQLTYLCNFEVHLQQQNRKIQKEYKVIYKIYIRIDWQGMEKVMHEVGIEIMLETTKWTKLLEYYINCQESIWGGSIWIRNVAGMSD